MCYKAKIISKEEKIKCCRDKCVVFDGYVLSGSRANPKFVPMYERSKTMLTLAFYEGEAERLVSLLNEAFADTLIDERIITILFKEADIKPFYN